MEPESTAPMPHHPVAELFPMMSGLDFAAFKADVQANGQLDPIWTWQGRIIDGRNRERACRELGLEPQYREWDGRGSLVAFVVSLNLRRRHLDETQRAVIAAKLKPMLAREAAERKASPEPELSVRKFAHVDSGSTSQAAGALLNVSARSVDSAAKVLRDGAPALVEAVERGEVAVSVAATVAELPKREQARAVKSGTVKEAASRVRAAKADRPAKPTRETDPAAEWAATVRGVRGRIRQTLADARFAVSHDDWTDDARRTWVDALRELVEALRASLKQLEGGDHASR